MAEREGVQIHKDEEDHMIVAFMRNVPKSEANRSRIDWTCFQKTITSWVCQMSNDVVNAVQDNRGHMSRLDREALHSVIRAFFIRSGSNDDNKAAVSNLLEDAHGQVENLERDVENMDISGNTNQADNEESIKTTLEISRQLLDNIDQIMNNIGHHQNSVIAGGWQQLRQMLSAAKVSTLKHQLNENKNFLKNLFKALLKPVYSQHIISALFVEIPDANLMVEAKINAIECLALMTHGLTCFHHEHKDHGDHAHHAGLYDLTHWKKSASGSTRSSGAPNDPENEEICHALAEFLMSSQILDYVKHAIEGPYAQIRQRAFMALGHYIKNGLNVTEYLYERVHVQIEPDSTQETLQCIAWFLFILAKNEFCDEKSGLNNQKIQVAQGMLPMLM